MSIEQDGTPKFPYNIGRQYYAAPSGTAYNNSDTRANNDFTDPGGRIIHAEGGPESDVNCPLVEVLSGTDDIILTWTGVEGGTYEITSSTDLSTFTEMQDKTISALTNGSPAGTITDAGILPSEEKKFYRVNAESVAPFDDTGFVLDTISEASQSTTVTITLDTVAPSNLSAVPNNITLNGEGR